MDNHFHAVVQADDLPRVIADLKKFTAGKLLAQLEAERRTWLFDLLTAGKAEHKTRSTYQLWQESYHAQAIYSDRTMGQKIDYIHANPVRRGWVTSPEHWRYSSTNGSPAPSRSCAAIRGSESRRMSAPTFLAPRSQS